MSKVLLAMSGGIDSSVSAVLLREQGHDVVGVFMRHGAKTESAARPGKAGCCSLNDAYDARRVADQLGIPFYVLNFEEEFGKIIDYFVGEYDRGATPNPCVVCNRDLKFGKLFAYADTVGAEFVATGHYARVEDRGGRRALLRGVDPDKDQSYVLFPLTQPALRRTLFPIGGLEKPAVREVARRAGLRIAEKPESQEICFVPGGDYRAVVRERIPERIREGEFRLTDGTVVGRHPGHQGFTVGQRRGLGIAFGRPIYVVAIESETNTVVLGEDPELFETTVEVREVNWVSRQGQPGETFEGAAKIRYNQEAAPARMTVTGEGRVRVEFAEPVRAVTPGQAAVFYDGETVLCGGWIETKKKAASNE